MDPDEIIGKTSAITNPPDGTLDGSVEAEQEIAHIAKVWGENLHDEKDIGSNPDNEQASEVSKEQNLHRIDVEADESITSSNYVLPKVQVKETASLFSILPCGITLDTELRESCNNRKRKSWKGNKLIYASCCSLDPYDGTKDKLSYSSSKIEDFYNNVKKDLERLEAELFFESPAKFSAGLNILGAQIWFVSLALGIEISGPNLDTEDSKTFQKMYKCLIENSILLLKINANLAKSLIDFENVTKGYLGSLKRTYAGASGTNLAQEKLSKKPIPAGQKHSSVTDLAIRAMINKKLWENRSETKAKLYESNDECIEQTLKQRQEFDIFIRNITKSGWVNFQVHVLPKVRTELLQEILGQAAQGVKIVQHHLPKLGKKLKRTCTVCKCHLTCTPWIKRMSKYVDIIMTNANYDTNENESIRLQIFAVEIFLTNIITRGAILRKKVRNITGTILLCCNYLEHLNFFQTPNYDSFTELKTYVSYDAIKKSTSKKFEVSDFFFNDYIIALKHVPIRYGMTEYILLNKISESRQHSGVNFDGPRFLTIN